MFRLLSLAVLLITGSTFAHARLKTPVPRNNSDLLKDPNGPCGNVPRTGMNTQYTAGQQIPVAFEETVNHGGCFTVAFSQANDMAFTRLRTVAHTTVGALPRQYTTNAQLPAGVTCDNCTLQLIQYMLSNYDGGMCPPANPPAGSRYYSCADIQVVAAFVDAGVDAGAGGGAPDAGAGGGAGGGAEDAGAEEPDAGSAGGGTGGAGGGSGGGAAGGGAGGSSGGVVQGNDAPGCSAMPVGGLAAFVLAVALRRRKR